MKIKSVSQLDEKTGITIPSLIETDSYIEVSTLSGQVDDLSLYNSYKLSFSEYNRQISNVVEDVKRYVDERCQELSNVINQLSTTVMERLSAADKKIDNYMREAHDIFVHKKPSYTEPEYIYGTKIFVDKVFIQGKHSLLSSDTVIEGTSRRSLWG